MESATPPQLYIYSGSDTIVYSSSDSTIKFKDAYIIADTAESTGCYRDTLIFETGMVSKINFTLPSEDTLDSITQGSEIINASVLLSARDSFPHSIECISAGESLKIVSTISGIYPENTVGIDVLSAINDSSSNHHLIIEPRSPASTPEQTSLRSDSFYLYLIYKSAPSGREGL